MKDIDIHVHGSSDPNGRGAWAATLLCGTHRKVIEGTCPRSSAAVLELEACFQALSTLKYRCKVRMHVSNQNIRRAFVEHWIQKWRTNGWRTVSGGLVQYKELWQRLAEVALQHDIEWLKAKGPEQRACARLARDGRLCSVSVPRPRTSPMVVYQQLEFPA